jgi:hypothetical protein
MFTNENFNAVGIGASIVQIEDMYGPPYDVRTLPNGLKEYRYIQRIYVNENAADQIEYVFTVSDGRIIDKQIRHIGQGASLQVM